MKAPLVVLFLTCSVLCATAQESDSVSVSKVLACDKAFLDRAAQDKVTIQKIDAPIGSVVASLLDKEHFACTVNGSWMIADGSLIPAGTTLHGIYTVARFLDNDAYKGMSEGTGGPYSKKWTIPDMRGRFLRGRNFATYANPDGDLQTGTSQEDDVGPHTHNVSSGIANGGNSPNGSSWHDSRESDTSDPIPKKGLKRAETRPKNVTVVFYVRVD